MKKFYITTDENGNRNSALEGTIESRANSLHSCRNVTWVNKPEYIFGGYWRDNDGCVWFPDIEYRSL